MHVGHAHNHTPVARSTRAASAGAACVAADNKRQIGYDGERRSNLRKIR